VCVCVCVCARARVNVCTVWITSLKSVRFLAMFFYVRFCFNLTIVIYYHLHKIKTFFLVKKEGC